MTRDALSVPTIRSRLSYDAIPIKYAYLLDVEDCSSEDELRLHVELLAENRRRMRRLVRRIKDLNAKKSRRRPKD